MDSFEIKMPLCWKEINETDRPYIDIPTGRISGKTKNTVIFSLLGILANPFTDIVVTRSSYGSMQDSSYAEYQAQFDELPDSIKEQFDFKKSPLRVERKGNAGTIYFIGAGGSNTDRTKGLKTSHPVKVVIIEETQEFKTKESYDQFMASVRRNFEKTNPKIITLGNPPNNLYHWFNKYIKRCEEDKSHLVVRMSWEDIVDFLNDFDIIEIIKTKLLDPEYARWLYYGEPTGALGRVYPMFRKDIHVIPYETRSMSRMLQDFQIRAVLVGCDGAVNEDKTVFVPRAIMSNGQTVALKRFIHDPKKDGVKGSFPLVENEGKRWFAELIRENNLDNPYDYYNSIPIFFVVDSAATELIQALRYYFGNRAEVYAIKKGTILQMVDVVQSAISKNTCAIYDYGGYYDYTLNKWIDNDPLVEEYQALIWNEKQNGYDPTIPNDCTDADTYGIYFWFRYTENIVWLQDVVNARKDYYILKN